MEEKGEGQASSLEKLEGGKISSKKQRRGWVYTEFR